MDVDGGAKWEADLTADHRGFFAGENEGFLPQRHRVHGGLACVCCYENEMQQKFSRDGGHWRRVYESYDSSRNLITEFREVTKIPEVTVSFFSSLPAPYPRHHQTAQSE